MARSGHRQKPTRFGAPGTASDRSGVVMAVLRLLVARGPAAIAGFIGTVVVDAIQRMHWRRAWPHIVQKRREIGQPALADRDPSAPVPGISGGKSVSAALFHGQPRAIFTAHGRAMFGDDCPVQAPAALMFAARQVMSMRDTLMAAVAATQPSPFHALFVRQRQHCQPPESAANQIQSFSHWRLQTASVA